ncbi:MAG: LuxR C-terminal-related transcriptional regulator [Thermomicrobiales bacterium]
MSATPRAAGANTLPTQLTSFIGRERELEELVALLASVRLLTLTGPGGCGKTRLAWQVAATARSSFPDGVWWVELAALTDPALVPQAIITALGGQEQPDRALSATLTDLLYPRNALLLLDNCEHLIDAVALLAETLLRECPALRIIATSREALRIPGETSWPVPPLMLPGPLPSANGAAPHDSEAVRLFIERATALMPTFTVTAANIQAIAEICRRLDGIPLAIELAAARANVLSVEQIAGRLDDALRLLKSSSRSALPRHQTLRTTIDWSYRLLPEAERLVFRHLAVCAGGGTLEVIEAICAEGAATADADEAMVDTLSRLADKSLILVDLRSGEARYRLLETLRQYGYERLVEAGEEEAARRRHLAWYLALAERADAGLIGPQQVIWLDRLEREHDNLRAALSWSLERGDGAQAAQLGAHIWHFWLFRGYLSEGRRWLERALAQVQTPVALRAAVLRGASLLALYQNDDGPATALITEGLALWRALGDQQGTGHMLHALGLIAHNAGDYARAVAHFEEALPLLRAVRDRRVIGFALSGLALTCLCLDDYARATALCEEGLALAREEGTPQGIAGALTTLAIPVLEQGDSARAHRLCAEAVQIRQALGDRGGMAHTRAILGRIALYDGDPASALAQFTESLLLRRDLGDNGGIAVALEGLAGVANALHNPGDAARLAGAADAIRAQVGIPLPSSDQPFYRRIVAEIRQGLTEAAYAAAWTAGQALPPDRAITLALSLDSAAASAPPPAPAADAAPLPAEPATSTARHFGLTSREVEVLRLTTLGLTYAQIAERLSISPRTADAHLRAIYGKLGVTSRTAATRIALEQKLV